MLRKGVIFVIIGLFIGASILPSISGTIKKDENEKIQAINSSVLFEDDFNDNIKDFTKWSELYSQGTWEEINQRTEFFITTGGAAYLEGIKSKNIDVSISSSNPLEAYADMISLIESSGDSAWGQLYFEINDGTNWIVANYHRSSNELRYADSQMGGTHVYLGSTDDGTWSNKIVVHPDKYKVIMKDIDSGWVNKAIFSTDTTINVFLFIRRQPAGTFRAGFDNVIVEGGNRPPIVYDIPDQSINQNEIFEDIKLSDYVYDPDGDEITWSFSGNTALNVNIYKGIARVWTNDPYWYGSETIRFIATDIYGASDWDDATFTISGENAPPDPPGINGPITGKTGIDIEYEFSLSDPDHDNVSLWVDWGDNHNTGGYLGPYESGTTVKLKHRWESKGVYVIKAKALDEHGKYSETSSLEVRMPKTRPLSTPLNIFIKQHLILYQFY